MINFVVLGKVFSRVCYVFGTKLLKRASRKIFKKIWKTLQTYPTLMSPEEVINFKPFGKVFLNVNYVFGTKLYKKAL